MAACGGGGARMMPSEVDIPLMSTWSCDWTIDLHCQSRLAAAPPSHCHPEAPAHNTTVIATCTSVRRPRRMRPQTLRLASLAALFWPSPTDLGFTRDRIIECASRPRPTCGG